MHFCNIYSGVAEIVPLTAPELVFQRFHSLLVEYLGHLCQQSSGAQLPKAPSLEGGILDIVQRQAIFIHHGLALPYS